MESDDELSVAESDETSESDSTDGDIPLQCRGPGGSFVIISFYV